MSRAVTSMTQMARAVLRIPFIHEKDYKAMLVPSPRYKSRGVKTSFREGLAFPKDSGLRVGRQTLLPCVDHIITPQRNSKEYMY